MTRVRISARVDMATQRNTQFRKKLTVSQIFLEIFFALRRSVRCVLSCLRCAHHNARDRNFSIAVIVKKHLVFKRFFACASNTA
jgi:hypothetical protein